MKTRSNGSKVAKTYNQSGRYYTQLLINTDQVVESRFHGTEKGADNYAEKFLNS